ncbi:MAG: LytTR family DNA-binding domain-containing protein [Eubacteriales bacterium]|nr:LytTR family DNA-binding domain-containing protein [Eubacteriales bacterium]
MLSIAICDDDVDQLALIQISANRYFAAHPTWMVQYQVFDNPFLLLDQLEMGESYQVALLDICMPEISGTDIAKQIRARHDPTEIVFLTTSNEYAVDAFALKAAHYLLKPFTQAQFDEAMDRALTRFAEGTSKSIPVKAEGGIVQKVDIDEILYIESQKHLLTLYLFNGTITEGQRSLIRFMEELEKLAPGQFVAPYKGYIVNQKAIVTIEPEKLILRGGACIPIPKRRYREIQNNYFDYMFPKNGGKR